MLWRLIPNFHLFRTIKIQKNFTCFEAILLEHQENKKRTNKQTQCFDSACFDSLFFWTSFLLFFEQRSCATNLSVAWVLFHGLNLIPPFDKWFSNFLHLAWILPPFVKQFSVARYIFSLSFPSSLELQVLNVFSQTLKDNGGNREVLTTKWKLSLGWKLDDVRCHHLSLLLIYFLVVHTNLQGVNF